jgi:HEAT repeat protein
LLYRVPAVRESVVWEARRLGPAALPYLRRALDDHDARVRLAAIRSLHSQPMGASGVPALIQALEDDRAEMRLAAARGLRVLGGQARAATPALITTLRDPDAEVRAAAVEAFFFFGSAARPAVPGLVACLEDPDADVRLAAVCSLARLSGEKDVPPVVGALSNRLLHDGDARVRAETARWLPNLGPAAREVLTQALDDPEDEVRRQARSALDLLDAVEGR